MNRSTVFGPANPSRCHMCGLPLAHWATVDGYEIQECLECGHRMVPAGHVESSVEELYADNYFTEGGAGYTDYLSGRWALRARAERYRRIIAKHGKTAGRALEIGSAAGFTLGVFRRRGWQVGGIEPNAMMARYSSEQLGIPTTVGVVEDLEPPGDLDLVLMLQVLEHLRSPTPVLNRVRHALVPDGLVLVETWSLNSLIARWLGLKWHQYSPPTVLHWFSAGALVRIMRSAGFRLVAMGRPLKLITLQNGISLLRAKHPRFDTPLSRRIAQSAFGRLAVPYPPLDLFWALFTPKQRSK